MRSVKKLSWLALLPIFLALLGVQGAVGAEQFTIIPRESAWKFFSYGEADSIWKDADYNPWFWPEGPAQLGYGEGDEQTSAYDGLPESAPTTIYFRTAFEITNRAEIELLTLRVVADDGVVVYLNGYEIYRRNLPGGPINFSTEALMNVETNENMFIQFGLWPYTLFDGPNVLCAELHQHPAGRTDASFDLELVANIPAGLPTVAITSPVDGSILSGGNVRLEIEVMDPAAGPMTVVYYTNNNFFASISQEPFSVIWTNPPKGGHLISAQVQNHFYSISESPPVHFYIGQPVVPGLRSGPYLQSGSTTGLVVRWRTDWYANSVVQYGTNPGQLSLSVTNSLVKIDHEVALTGLQPDTQYFYSVGTSTETLGIGSSFYFRTSPTNTRPVRLWVVGDSGKGNANAAAVRDAYYNYGGTPDADLFLMLGDNAYETGTDGEHQNAVFNVYGELLRHTTVWPTLGNHDAGEDVMYFKQRGGPYLDLFTLPTKGQSGGIASGSELYYSFDYANIHVVCLDSFASDRSTNSPMFTWLATDLETTEKDWIIAFWHHPPYSWGSHNSDHEPELFEMRERALPLLEAYGVDLVLSGHSHSYERSFLLKGHYGRASTLEASMIVDGSVGRTSTGGPYRKPSGGLGAHQGAVYTVCGCSGEGGVGEGFPLHPAMALNHGGFGSLVIDVNGLSLTARFLRPSGAVDDEFTIDKGQPTTLVPRLGAAAKTNRVLLTWPTSALKYSLEQSTGLPPSQWQGVPKPLALVGRQHEVEIPRTSSAAFFRLKANP
ncbi:MAG: metallophosphoesterase [Verrucomicrobiales bacterium]|nr:metallophosphoesterase [Verrucomicrobiales bacterium]